MLSKPSWLREWFDTLNWDVLTWQIYLGDALESAVDWVIDWLNWLLDGVTRSLNYALDLFNQVREWTIALFSEIWKGLNQLWDQVEALWSQFTAWWSEVVSYVSEVSNTLRSEVMTWLADFLTFSWFSSWWGNMATTFSSWWDSAWQKILEAIDLASAAMVKEVNRHSSILETLSGFISNPVGYIWDRFLDWFLGA